MRHCILFLLFIYCIKLHAQSDEQVRQIYDHLAQKEVYYDSGILIYLEDLNLIDSAGTKKVFFDKLYDLIKKEPNAQVMILALSLDNYHSANRLNVYGGNFDDLSKLNKALKIAISQEDELLLSAFFSIYGITLELIKQPQIALFYFTKEHQILKRYKNQYKSLYEKNCFNLTKVLYQISEYQHSIEFGKLGLKLSEQRPTFFKDLQKVYLLDLIGASYKNLGKADSSIIYYQILADQLKKSPDLDIYQQQLWNSIVNGNIGENLLNLGKFDEAAPLVRAYYNFNQKNKDIYNIFLSTNLLARLQNIKGNIQEAKRLFKSVLSDPAALRKSDLVIKACDGLSSVYIKVGNIDSALYFQKMSLQEASKVSKIIYQSGLDAAESKIEFEKVQNELDHSKKIISQVKISRNLAILSLILATFLIITFYVLNRNKWRYKIEEQNLLQQMAEQKINDSKALLDNMTHSLIEKSNMVEQLAHQIQIVENAESSYNLKEQLTDIAITSDVGWDRFFHSFATVNPSFLGKLERMTGSLSPAELRLTVLIKVGLNNSQLASSLGISSGSVVKSKYRLKQKLNLSTNDSLESFLHELSSSK